MEDNNTIMRVMVDDDPSHIRIFNATVDIFNWCAQKLHLDLKGQNVHIDGNHVEIAKPRRKKKRNRWACLFKKKNVRLMDRPMSKYYLIVELDALEEKNCTQTKRIIQQAFKQMFEHYAEHRDEYEKGGEK